MVGQAAQRVQHSCTHCGDQYTEDGIIRNENHFCCEGCATVYEILSSSGLGGYYALNEQPGSSQKKTYSAQQFDVFDDEKVVAKILEFQEGNICKVRVSLPAIHCSSCIFLLENLEKIDGHVHQVRVDFLKKQAIITFEADEQFKLKQLFMLLSRIGYPPDISLQNLKSNTKSVKGSNRLMYQLGLAGFVFGNVMLLSFPEYLGFEEARNQFFLGYINLALATPLLFFGGADFITSAFRAIKAKALNIDVPLAIGIITLYFRSAYEILSNSGEGYFDSFSGLIFFLLIGRYVQQITHKAIDFERNYRSYFPISVLRRKNNVFETISLDEVGISDVLFIRTDEIIPTDGLVSEGTANIDYSFVTGESDLVFKKTGDKIYAGGRHKGHPFYMIADQSVDQSRLTKLWQEDVFKEFKNRGVKLLDVFGKYFTFAILAVAFITGVYWVMFDVTIMWYAVTAVLIVACPCAISMAPPFTYSNIMRLLAKNRFFLKNIQTVEHFQTIDHVIFDKTGTLTKNDAYLVKYEGKNVDVQELSMIKSLCQLSSHPLSNAIAHHLNEVESVALTNFKNHVGQGIEADLLDKKIKLGSSEFIFGSKSNQLESQVFLEIDREYKGHFTIQLEYREGLKDLFATLYRNGFKVGVLTGDSDRDDKRLREIVGPETKILYQQLPIDKLNIIKELQDSGKKVLMIGDGLNDAGALRQSDIGMVVTDKTNNFTPACDVIIDGQEFIKLPQYILFLKRSKQIIYGALLLAVLYNIVGLSFAISGNLSAVVAAILMPLSSITIILYAIVASSLVFYRSKVVK